MRRTAALGLLLVSLAVLLLGCAPDFSNSPTADRPLEPGEISEAKLLHDVLVADDGTRLPLRVWLPRDQFGKRAPVLAAVVAVHGFNDYSEAFRMPAEVWARQGIATFAYDQRGFGANPDPGRWPGVFTLTQDFAAAVRAVRRRYPDIPVYAVGESMGGAVVLAALGGPGALERPRLDGVVLVAPAVWARHTMPLAYRIALWASVRIMPGHTFTGRGLGIEASDNIPMLRRLAADKLFIKATRTDAIYGLVNLMDEALAAAPNLDVPALVLYGSHDQLIPKRPMRELADSLPERADGRQRFAYYRDGWHMLLRDLEGPLVADDVASWILDRRAPLPSGADRAAAAFLKGETMPEKPVPPPERLKGLAEPVAKADINR